MYIDDYSSSADITSNTTNSSSSNSTDSDSTEESTTGTSIFDTYSVYFNQESYRVTIIVIAYSVVIIGWMCLLLALGCIYRHVLEK